MTTVPQLPPEVTPAATDQIPVAQANGVLYRGTPLQIVTPTLDVTGGTASHTALLAETARAEGAEGTLTTNLAAETARA
ncbi:MAG: hypothetical protein P4L10_10865, partial [Acidobacteriaceae bacterium]|nr:hypothetical protein [Acidobacteriaceae bacterium]